MSCPHNDYELHMNKFCIRMSTGPFLLIQSFLVFFKIDQHGGAIFDLMGHLIRRCHSEAALAVGGFHFQVIRLVLVKSKVFDRSFIRVSSYCVVI